MTDGSPPVLNRSVPAGIFVKVDILSNFVWRFSIVVGEFVRIIRKYIVICRKTK